MAASGIHAHDKLKLGLLPPANKDALKIASYFTGVPPDEPVSADHLKNVTFALDHNDSLGVCGPTSVDNLIRLVSTGLTGKTTTVKLNDVYDLYRRSGNPDFDPATGADDNGVGMQTMLEALIKGGIGTVKPICFGRVPLTDEAINTAVAIFGGVLYGVSLQVSQQIQSQATNIVWDYHAPHQQWGGHAICGGQYANGKDGAISWKKQVEMTPSFRRYQLGEAWVVVFHWHLDHPAFLAGIDLAALKADYQSLTGSPLAVPKKAVQASLTATRDASDEAK